MDDRKDTEGEDAANEADETDDASNAMTEHWKRKQRFLRRRFERGLRKELKP